MKATHAIVRISLLLVINCAFIFFYHLFPDAKTHGWVLTALSVVFTIGDSSVAIVLKGFDDIESDPTLDRSGFRRIRPVLLKRRSILRRLISANVFFRVISTACGLVLINKPELNSHNSLVVIGYLFASFGVSSLITLFLNMFDVWTFG
jgi:hypothetical protein